MPIDVSVAVHPYEPHEMRGGDGCAANRQIARSAMLGVASMSMRQVVVQLSNLLGGIVFARELSPRDYGFYGITLFIVAFLSSFGDVGLGASLVRQPQTPTEHDYRCVFGFQQLLVLGATLLSWGVSWLVMEREGVPNSGRFVFYAATLSVLIASFQSIPAIRLERALAFHRLALVEVAQALSFNIVASVLILHGFEMWSFGAALLVRSSLGALLIQTVSRWRIAWSFDWNCVKKHLAFGIHFQAFGFTFLVKDSIVSVLVSTLAGAAAVGYLNWSATVAGYSIVALMVLQRIYLPAFARLQADRAALGQFVERVVWASNAICAPLATLMLALFVPFTVFVFGSKWLAARDYFLLFWVANLLTPTSMPLVSLLNALGRAKVTLGFALIWAAGTWLIGAPLVVCFGAIGYAVADFAVQFTDLALFRTAQRFVPFQILVPILPAWTVAVGMGAVMWLVQRRFPVGSWVELIGYAAAGMSLYLLGLVIFDGAAIRGMRDLLRRPS